MVELCSEKEKYFTYKRGFLSWIYDWGYLSKASEADRSTGFIDLKPFGLILAQVYHKNDQIISKKIIRLGSDNNLYVDDIARLDVFHRATKEEAKKEMQNNYKITLKKDFNVPEDLIPKVHTAYKDLFGNYRFLDENGKILKNIAQHWKKGDTKITYKKSSSCGVDLIKLTRFLLSDFTVKENINELEVYAKKLFN